MALKQVGRNVDQIFSFEEQQRAVRAQEIIDLVADDFEFGHEVVVFVAERSEERADELVLGVSSGAASSKAVWGKSLANATSSSSVARIVLSSGQGFTGFAAVMTSGQKSFQCTAVCDAPRLMRLNNKTSGRQTKHKTPNRRAVKCWGI